MDDNRTVWELAFSESGLDPIITKTSAAEKHFDKLVASAVKAGAAIGSFGSSSMLQPLSDAELRTKNLETQFANSNKTLAQFTSAGKSALSEFATVAGIALGAVTAGAVAAGTALAKLDEHAVKAFGERTSTLRAYTTILGDARQAQVEYGKANELASKTELTSASTLKAQQALIVAGFRGADLTNALTASMDVASTKQPEERELTMERMGRAFSQILAAGKLRGQELNQLAEAGVNRGQVLDILGKGDAGAGEKAISAGQIGAQAGIAAVQQSILQTLGTKKLGEFATGASGSLGGLLSNRDEALDILLKTFDGETLPAMVKYKELLTDQTTALSSSSETGKGLVMMLSDFASITTNVKSLWLDFSTGFLETFVDSYNEAREGSGAFVAMTDSVKSLGQTLGKVGGLVGDVADSFESLMESIQPLSHWLSEFIGDVGNLYGAVKSGEGTKIQEAANRLMGIGGERVLEGGSGQEVNESAWKKFKSKQVTDRVEAEGNWEAFKEIGAAALESTPIASAVKTKWPKAGAGGAGKGTGGYDITGLMGGSSASASQGLAMRFDAAVGAAAAVSSASSARAQAEGSGGEGATGTTVVNIMAGAIVVSGVSDPTMAANEVYRLLGQTLGRFHRAPGGGVL